MSMLAWAVGPQGFGTYRLVWGDPPSTWERAEGEPEAVVAPGYVDLHIHGAFGMDFMSASSGDLVALAVGVGHFLLCCLMMWRARLAARIGRLARP